MEDSTVAICIDSQFAGKIAPTPRWPVLGATQNGFFVRAHTHSLFNICMFVSPIPLSIVTVEFGGARRHKLAFDALGISHPSLVNDKPRRRD